MMRTNFFRNSKRILKMLLAFLAIDIIVLVLAFPTFAFSNKNVTADQVNGTWVSSGGSFDILALGNKKLVFRFFGIWEGPTCPNVGEAEGIVRINGDTAIYEMYDEECTITMKFIKDKLIVEQVGICGFGLNVEARGIYRRTSNTPDFTEPDDY